MGGLPSSIPYDMLINILSLCNIPSDASSLELYSTIISGTSLGIKIPFDNHSSYQQFLNLKTLPLNLHTSPFNPSHHYPSPTNILQQLPTNPNPIARILELLNEEIAKTQNPPQNKSNADKIFELAKADSANYTKDDTNSNDSEANKSPAKANNPDDAKADPVNQTKATDESTTPSHPRRSLRKGLFKGSYSDSRGKTSDNREADPGATPKKNLEGSNSKRKPEQTPGSSKKPSKKPTPQETLDDTTKRNLFSTLTN